MDAEAVAALAKLPWKALLLLGTLLVAAVTTTASGAYFMGGEVFKYRQNQDRNNTQLVDVSTKLSDLAAKVDTIETRVTEVIEIRLTNGVVYECEATPTRGKFINCSRSKRR